MFRKMLASAVFAGVAAGLLATLLHFVFVQKSLLLAEEYESGAVSHFQGAAPAGHDHGAAAEPAGTEAHDHAAHDHGDAEAEPSDLQRNALTGLFSILVYTGYAMVLVAGFGLAIAYGRRIGAREGLLWGLAGYAAFQLAPALGLAPELPGTAAADLAARQVWWWGTVLATGAGLALLAYGRGPIYVVLALVLLAAPHLIGAPHLDGFAGVAPPELAATFAARVLGVGLAVWAVLGWTAGAIWSKETAQA
ncbi:CbtA family protein [Xinfangfangia pollutisoli]|uniref:CbtA family protein n=1 Tax=Xinfangfangia pollutisoli TaxID=2865960 RepID=UPI001CD3E3C0|nr:CbtA family protein [Xinfangfangia pollutisoli]